MTQVAENVEAVWKMNPNQLGYNEDLELRQNANMLVTEITDALRSTRNQFNDRGTIESALRDALESCSYQEEGLIQVSYREPRKNRKQTVEYVYLSTFPVHWDELELDQEINSIEEEIARIEEQKLLLKRSNSFSSSDHSGSESNSDVGSLSQSSSSADEQSDDENRFLPPLASATKRISKMELRQNNSKRRKIVQEEKKIIKNKKNQKKTLASSSPVSYTKATLKVKQEAISTTKSIGSFSMNSIESSQTSSSPTKKPVTSSPEKRKQTQNQIFQVEQVVKVKTVVCDENEDEDIDILN